MPGTISPEPVPLEQVTLAQRPSRSTAVMCVVEPSRSAAARRRASVEELGLEALLVEPVEELLGPRVLRRLHRHDHLLGARGAAAIDQLEGVGEQDAAR